MFSIGDYRSRYLAEDKKSVNGKVIKINIDSQKYEIVSIGHRNIQGLLYDKDKKLVRTDKIYLEIIGQWQYDFLNDVKNISEIKIRHQNNPVHKTFKIYFDQNQVNILNIDMPNACNMQEIINILMFLWQNSLF